MKIDGEAVRAARQAKAMSRAELAVAVGVSVATIERVEQNKGDVAAGTAYLIAQELGVRLESLFTRAGNGEPEPSEAIA